MLKSAASRFLKWYINEDLHQDPVLLLRAKFALLIGGPAVIISFALLGWTWYLEADRPAVKQLILVQCVIVTMLCASTVFLRWKATSQLPAHLQMVLVVGMLAHSAGHTGGLSSAALYIYPAIPVAAMMLSGARTMLLSVLAIAVSSAWMYYLHQSDQLPPQIFPSSIQLMLPTLGWSVLLTSTMVWYFQRQIIQAMRGSEAEIERRITVEAELRETEEALRHAKGLAEGANAAKGAFLAQVSHEIRNPLTALIGAIDLLELPAEDGVRRSRIALLRQSTRTLGELVDDILDFSKIEAGKLSITPIATDPVLLVEAVEEMYRAQAIAEGLDLRIEMGGDLPRAILIDPIRVEQVLRNLMSNAIKFTPDGQITLELATHTQASGERRLIFAVEDTGIGIPEAQQALIFEPYVQAEHAPSLEYSGTGLGLPISSRIISLMEGEFGLESTVGEGTRFWFSLPINEHALAEAEDRQNIPQPMSTATVLVVEDDPANRTILTDLLISLGANVTNAATGEEGVQAFKRHQPQLILMDIRMPGMDGIEATRRIRSIEKDTEAPAIPIIALTADVEVDRIAAYQEAGMTDLLPKPVTRAQLAKALQNWTRTAKVNE